MLASLSALGDDVGDKDGKLVKLGAAAAMLLGLAAFGVPLGLGLWG